MNVRIRLTVFAAAAALTVTACGTADTTSGAPGSDSTSTSMPMEQATGSSAAESSTTADTSHNNADVTFAQQMTVHHQGAIEMADLAPDRAESADVKSLAEKIKAAQAPEITLMTGWLRDWGVATTSGSSAMGGMGGMDNSSTGSDGTGSAMPGMMTDEQMQQLSKATGADFDKMFLEMMIVHHQGALEMSKTEKDTGQSSDAQALADAITKSQTAEIATMKALLQGE
jgi:uncharacterized protein (DUF305 family)